MRHHLLFRTLQLTENSYEGLKKQLYHLEKQQTALNAIHHDLESNENTTLIENQEADSVFTQSLDRELQKIATFYDHQAKEILDEVAEVEELVRQQDEADFNGNDGYPNFQDSDDDDEDEEEQEEDNTAAAPGTSRRRPSVTFSPDTRGTGKLLVTTVYTIIEKAYR